MSHHTAAVHHTESPHLPAQVDAIFFYPTHEAPPPKGSRLKPSIDVAPIARLGAGSKRRAAFGTGPGETSEDEHRQLRRAGQAVDEREGEGSDGSSDEDEHYPPDGEYEQGGTGGESTEEGDWEEM